MRRGPSRPHQTAAMEPPPAGGSSPTTRPRWLRPPATVRWSGWAPTWSPARCWPPTGPGLFPMPARRGLMAWWSPDPRGIVPLGREGQGCAVSRSLRKSCRRFEIRVDTAFDEVIEACADRRRPGAWIDRDIRRGLPGGCTSWAGCTAWKRGTRAAGWPAGCTAWRSGGCSPVSRCSTGRPTRPRWPWSAWLQLLRDAGAERAAARRAVGHAPPGVAGGGRGEPGPVPPTAGRAWRCPSPPSAAVCRGRSESTRLARRRPGA